MGVGCLPDLAPTGTTRTTTLSRLPRKDCAVTTYADEHWTAAAACAGDGRFTGDDVSEPVVEALAVVCAACPVSVQCNAFALEVEAAWGMWSGVWRSPHTLAASRRPAA